MTKIFIETSTKNNEYNFIKSIIKFYCNKVENKDYEIILTGGKDKLINFKNQFLDHEDSTEKNLVIFDSDFLRDRQGKLVQNGGFIARKQYLESIINTFNSSNKTSLFLFPNNNDDGAFEDLLEKIVVNSHYRIITHYKAYEMNISQYKDSTGNPLYTAPNEKERIYAYASAVKIRNHQEETNFRKGDWNFDDLSIWDLNNNYIVSLKNFLIKNL